MADPYGESLRQRMAEFAPGLGEHLEDVPNLKPPAARAVVEYLLHLSCRSGHIGFIQAGRRALVKIPREWLVERIESAASGALDLADEWQYRRFIELCCLLDQRVVRRVAERGLGSESAPIREAAREFRDGGAEFAARHAASVTEPPC